VLERDREELDTRIEERVAAMLREGLVEEVKKLRAAGFESNPSGARSIGYRETLAYLNGKYEFGNLESNIVSDTRRLAKKQRTWFRTQLPVSKTINLTKIPHLEISQLFR
jgi:tRNA dimethylallyltransferase